MTLNIFLGNRSMLVFPFKINKKRYLIIVVFVLFIVLISISFQKDGDPIKNFRASESSIFEMSVTASNEPIRPIPLTIDLDPNKVSLGDQLFHDPRLSKNNKISCASCHNLERGGTDRLVVSIGINGQKGKVNAPTVFNSIFNFKQFWDGRAETLEEQIDSPIHNAREMGSSSWSEIIKKLKQSPEYVSLFKSLYADGITSDTIKDVIAEFERSLITPNSRFDQFLRGDEKALNLSEKEGYRLFKSDGCASCHQGINVGGNMFQSLGLFGNYFQDRGNITPADLGRYNITKDDRDRYVFKVPSLRNVAITAPYFHDGSVKTLTSAVEIMSQYQLGRELSKDEIEAIVKFLIALTGEYRGNLLK
jgi:cytochrome c peroxidase